MTDFKAIARARSKRRVGIPKLTEKQIHTMLQVILGGASYYAAAKMFKVTSSSARYHFLKADPKLLDELDPALIVEAKQ